MPEDDRWLTRIEVTLCQGRHHQVRRLCKRAQLKLVALRRIAIGPLALDTLGLPMGTFSPLPEAERACKRTSALQFARKRSRELID